MPLTERRVCGLCGRAFGIVLPPASRSARATGCTRSAQPAGG